MSSGQLSAVSKVRAAMSAIAKAPSLSAEQQEELAKHLDEKTYLTSNAIRAYVKKTYRVEYSP